MRYMKTKYERFVKIDYIERDSVPLTSKEEKGKKQLVRKTKKISTYKVAKVTISLDMPKKQITYRIKDKSLHSLAAKSNSLD